ncbi:MAG: hypothetical protein J6U23_02510 [Clostridiales bacterium]|nr:hypothetical protein [Clostridiales bacterium]
MKKVVSIFLASFMLISLAGCSAFGGSKISAKKFDKFVKEELDPDDMDADDIVDCFEDDDLEDLEDGVYCEMDDGDFEDVFADELDLGELVAEPEKIDTAKTYLAFNEEKEKATIYIYLTFKDEKKAGSFLEDTVDFWDDDLCDTCSNWAIADETEGELFGMFERYSTTLSIAMYQQGADVLFCIAINEKSAISDIAEYFGITDPTDALKDGLKGKSDKKKDKKDKDDDDDDD